MTELFIEFRKIPVDENDLTPWGDKEYFNTTADSKASFEALELALKEGDEIREHLHNMDEPCLINHVQKIDSKTVKNKTTLRAMFESYPEGDERDEFASKIDNKLK